LSAARLAPFRDEVARAREAPLLTRDDLRGTALAPMLDALLMPAQGGTWMAWLPLYPVALQPLDAAALQTDLKTIAGAQVLDVHHELEALYAGYLSEALIQALLGALAVVALLALSMRSLRRVLRVCLPLAVAVLLCLGVLQWLQVPLGVLHLVGLLLVVAVGSNYALFFDDAQRGGLNDDTLASLLLANLATVASFGLLAGSDVAVLSAIGRVVAPGALLALLLAAAFARPASERPAV
jgi:predicted exporter